MMNTVASTRTYKPLDPNQYRLWHRLRRMPRFVLVVVLGALITSGLIVGLNALMTWLLAGVVLPGRAMLLMFGGVMVATWLSFAWTWSYMQKRYHATSGLLCTTCGYTIIGLHSPLCPECGKPWGFELRATTVRE